MIPWLNSARWSRIIVFGFILTLMGASGAIAGGVTSEKDTAYLSWIREQLNTNFSSSNWTGTPEKNLLIFSGEALNHSDKIDLALKGSRFLVVVLPPELKDRVYPRVFAAYILNREYQFDGVAVLSGDEGGFESRFGWSQCHDILNKTGTDDLGQSTLNAAPGVIDCLDDSKPKGWEEARGELLNEERQDNERKQGVGIVKYNGPPNSHEPKITKTAFYITLIGVALLSGMGGFILARIKRK